ncbi:MAG: lysozyme inhibitor LprI family protein [Sediminibacterium sp.]|uniref:lysozyme inhibitor LprI family protein n=1 Tax=Flavobacterium sp. TaxID=239 RepID=UPI003265B4CD
MKQMVLLSFLMYVSLFSYGQKAGLREITPEDLQKINEEIEKKIPSLTQELIRSKSSKDEIEFSIDTFRIRQIAAKKISINYSTSGMNRIIVEMTESYKKLMNKYYNKLLNSFERKDRATLVAAQKGWLIYREAETKLIHLVNKKTYTGGGTMYSTIATELYSDLVLQRTLEIFRYYKDIASAK